MIDNKFHTPNGVWDILPDESLRLSHVADKIKDVFVKYGFCPVETPTFEYVEVFSHELGTVDTTLMYKLFDRDGSTLALRPDMTPPVARLCATTYADDTVSRLCYFGNAYRYNESYQGKLHEFKQAGVELVGVKSADCDAEILAVAINSILSSGIENFRLEIGEVNFFKGIMDEAGFDNETSITLHTLLDAKDFASIEKIIQYADITEDLKKLFMNLPKLTGGADVLSYAKKHIRNEKSLKSIEWLESIYEILAYYDVQKYVGFDLAMLSNLGYYTGIIFKGYTYEAGFSILDGGRYDNLLDKFNAAKPSIGFAVKLNDLLMVITRQNIDIEVKKVQTLIVSTELGKKSAVQTANELRKQGLLIENSYIYGDIDKNIDYAKQKNINGIIYFIDEDNVELINLIDNSRVKTSISEVLNR